MSRHTAAIAATLPKTVTVNTAPAANDAAREPTVGPVPQYTISPELSAKLRVEAMALAVETIKPLPRKPDEYLAWVERTQGRAWTDQHLLARVPLEDGAVTRAEINAFGERIEWVRQVLSDDRAEAPDETPVALLTTEQLAERIDKHQQVVHNGLMLVLAKDPESRATLSESGRKRSKASRSARTSLLLSYAAKPAIERVLRALPCGEGASVDALETLHPEWSARLKNDSNERSNREVSFVERAFATLQPTLQRVLLAGRYLERSMPGHEGTYPGFVAPKSRKVKAETVVQPSPVTPR